MKANSRTRMADTGGKGDIRSALTNLGGWKSLIVVAVLTLACIAGFSSRLFAVIRFESIIHEFDPWCVPTKLHSDFVNSKLAQWLFIHSRPEPEAESNRNAKTTQLWHTCRLVAVNNHVQG